jgi:hypothetical protein
MPRLNEYSAKVKPRSKYQRKYNSKHRADNAARNRRGGYLKAKAECVSMMARTLIIVMAIHVTMADATCWSAV